VECDGRLMLEILVILIAMIIMARRPTRRRRMGRYIRGNIDENLGLGTETVNERTLVTSIIASWSLSNWTPAEGRGPVVVGVAHSDYTDPEIEAYIENTGSWNEGSKVEQEIGRRKIRRVGQFDIPSGATVSAVLNDGKPIRTKLNWILNQGQTLRYWAYNQGTLAIATTIPDVRLQGHANLFPK